MPALPDSGRSGPSLKPSHSPMANVAGLEATLDPVGRCWTPTAGAPAL
jgi:hypothetical protein